MAKKKTAKSSKGSAAVMKKPKPRKTAAKKKEVPVDIEGLRERMKTHKPPQSWYEEDHTGLY